uniref:PHD-type domain-containing protein n=1 Tax=Attheya septentrionalis TaxID=420275 RepID=A0A7S2UKG5_9STRA
MQTRRWTKKELMDSLFPGGLTLRRIEPIFEETISSDNAETLKHGPSGELRVEESRAAVNCGSSNGLVVLHEKCDQLSMEKAQPTEDTTTTEATSLAPEGGEVLDQEDNIICNVCFSGEEPEDNDVLLCDGVKCFRSVHMKCVVPNVTQQIIDEQDAWFCPYCDALGNLVHYVQVEYYGDEWEERRKRKLLHTVCAKSVTESDQEDVDDNDSIVSWNGAEDIFPEAEHEHMVAVKWKEGVRDELAGEFLSSYFGITTGDSNPLDISVMYGEDEEDSDDDEDFELNDNERKDSVGSDGDDSDDEDESVASSESSSLGDLSSIECEIDKAELDALSACSSTSDSDGDSISENEDSSKNSAESDSDSNVRPERRTRRKRRTTVALSTDSDNDSKPKLKVDDGTLDTTNIVHGKRNRTKVDYRRLNDAMFGEVTAEEAAQLFGNEEDDEYRFGMETPAKTNPKAFSGKKRGRSKKKKSSPTEPVMKKRRGRPPKKS